jgi:hypothetical protein
MFNSLECPDNQRRAPDRKTRVQHNLFTVVGITFVFMGLVVLPQTRTGVWSPSKAGYSDFMVGP